jgi:hypothetical protein
MPATILAGSFWQNAGPENKHSTVSKNEVKYFMQSFYGKAFPKYSYKRN